jgi:hypothetical protein
MSVFIAEHCVAMPVDPVELESVLVIRKINIQLIPSSYHALVGGT